MKNPSDSNQLLLRTTRHKLLRGKRAAKRQWQLTYASKCQKHDFCINPKEAWNMIFKLIEGFQNHHKVFIPKNFKSKSGIIAKTDEENANILNSHFQSLFNSQIEPDFSVLDELPQHKAELDLDKWPTKAEIESAIKQMADDKAP
jgi:hypothetical protein